MNNLILSIRMYLFPMIYYTHITYDNVRYQHKSFKLLVLILRSHAYLLCM